MRAPVSGMWAHILRATEGPEGLLKALQRSAQGAPVARESRPSRISSQAAERRPCTFRKTEEIEMKRQRDACCFPKST